MKNLIAMLVVFVCVAASLDAGQDPITQIQKITPSGLRPNDQCGRNLVVDGLRMATGASGLKKAWVYKRTAGQFEVEGVLLPSDNQGHGFGDEVVINGSWVAVGAPGGNAVYMFAFQNAQWVFTQKIMEAGGNYGSTIDISGDSMIVGALSEQNGKGAAYVYRLTNGVWILEQRLVQSDGQAGDLFGNHVAIDANTVLVDSRGDDDVAFNAGSVFVFERTGTTWAETQKVQPSDLGSGDMFGYVLDLEDDRFVATCFYQDTVSYNSGAAYVYKRQEDGTWLKEQKLQPHDPGFDRIFGRSVTIHRGRILVGSTNDPTNGQNAGAAYLFKLRGGIWTEDSKVIGNDTEANDQFGISVGLSDQLAAVGAYGHDHSRGAVYMFHENLLAPSFAHARIHGTHGNPRGLAMPRLDNQNVTGMTFILEVRQGNDWLEVARQTAANNECPDLIDEDLPAYSSQAHYRMRVIDDYGFEGPDSEMAVATLAADFDNDTLLDQVDLMIFKAFYGTQKGDLNWDIEADLNLDGVIDVQDVEAMKTWFDPEYDVVFDDISSYYEAP